jgi:acyl-coenzyme A synthetase/AMP-(fatty) acid ligase
LRGRCCSTDAERGETIVACVVVRNGTNAEELRQFLRTEIDVWTTVIRQARVKPNT